MAVYLLYMASPVIVALFLTAALRVDINKGRNKTVYLVICGIIIALFIGLRHYNNGSGDSRVYYNLWEKLSDMPIDKFIPYLKKIDMESGFLAAVWILSKFFAHPQFMFILSGILFAASICHFVKNNCENPMLGLLVFNCLGMFNFMVQGLRQAIAMSICFFALEYCKKKKPLKFFILIAIAMLFHASAIVFAVVYLLSFFKLTLKSVATFAVIAGVGILLMPFLFRVINSIINDDYHMNNTENSTGGVVAILIYLAIIIFALMMNDYKNPDKKYTLFVYMAAVGMISLVLRNTVSTILERVGMYFACGQMVLVSDSVERVNSRTTKTIFLTMVVFLCLAVAVYKTSYSDLIPYKFFWQ